MHDTTRMADNISVGSERHRQSPVAIAGSGHWELFDYYGRMINCGEFGNLVTQVGDQFYGERATGIAGAPAAVTGMRLGTGSTAVAKTGAGAAIVTYVSGSSVALDATYPQSALSGSSRRITFKTTFLAGVATTSGLAEVVITNEVGPTDVAGTAANTLSRALLSPTINKGASDVLSITWNHDLLGA